MKIKITDDQLSVLVDTVVNLMITNEDTTRKYKNGFQLFDAYVDELEEECPEIFSEISARDDDDASEYWETMNFVFEHVMTYYRF